MEPKLKDEENKGYIMEPELKDLENKTKEIEQLRDNGCLTSKILYDYIDAFNALSRCLRAKLYSLDNTHLHHIMTDDDIEDLQFYHNLC